MNEDDVLERYLDDQDEEEEMRDEIKIPSDLEDEDDDLTDELGGRLDDENEEFDQFADAQEEDFDRENDIFKKAKANDEMEL